jgi:hypothetical protein
MPIDLARSYVWALSKVHKDNSSGRSGPVKYILDAEAFKNKVIGPSGNGHLANTIGAGESTDAVNCVFVVSIVSFGYFIRFNYTVIVDGRIYYKL